MGVQPFLIPASLNIVIAQRLVKRLCQKCKSKMSMSELGETMVNNIKHAISITAKSELQSRVAEELKNPTFFKPVGCDACDHTGYKGRVGLYEVLEITP